MWRAGSEIYEIAGVHRVQSIGQFQFDQALDTLNGQWPVDMVRGEPLPRRKNHSKDFERGPGDQRVRLGVAQSRAQGADVEQFTGTCVQQCHGVAFR